MIRRRASVPAVGLSPNVVATLLAGWGACGPDGWPDDRVPGYDLDGIDTDDALFELMQGRDRAVIDLWQRHESYLRGEAARLGIKPMWPIAGRRRGFFGEHCLYERAVAAKLRARSAPRDDDDNA